jgi:hypothetical protein
VCLWLTGALILSPDFVRELQAQSTSVLYPLLACNGPVFEISLDMSIVRPKPTLERSAAERKDWSARQAAETNRLSKSTVRRVFQTFALQSHRIKTFKLPNDAVFVEKVSRCNRKSQ